MKHVFLLLAGLVPFGLAAADKPPLGLEQTIVVSGVKGRFDHLAVDLKTKRLFVAAAENNSLEVVDLAASKHLQSLTGMAKPCGVIFLPQSNRILVANSDDATVKIFDAATLKLVKTLYSLLDADNLRVEPGSGLVYVGYGSGALGVLDQKLVTMDRSYKMPGHPESFQFEANGTRVFVNVPTAKGIAVLDRAKRKAIEKWPLTGFEENFPMALDESQSRLFIGCRKPARLVVLDSQNGKPVADVPIARDTDDLFWDAKRNRIYLSCGEGFVDCVQQSAGDKYERKATVESAEGARTSLFSPDLDRFYLAVPAVAGREAEIRVYRPE